MIVGSLNVCHTADQGLPRLHHMTVEITRILRQIVTGNSTIGKRLVKRCSITGWGARPFEFPKPCTPVNTEAVYCW